MSYFLFVFVVLISPPPFKCLCFFPGITFSLTTAEAAYWKVMFSVAFFFLFAKNAPPCAVEVQTLGATPPPPRGATNRVVPADYDLSSMR